MPGLANCVTRVLLPTIKVRLRILQNLNFEADGDLERRGYELVGGVKAKTPEAALAAFDDKQTD